MSIELPLASAESAPLPEELSLGGEHLDPMILSFGYVDLPEPVHRYPNRILELAFAAAQGAPLPE